MCRPNFLLKKLGKTWCLFTIFHAEFDLVEDEFVLEIVHFAYPHLFATDPKNDKQKR